VTPDASLWGRLRRGAGLGIPIFLGYVPIGAAFGILAREAGFSAVQAVACSALVLAGAGQFVAVALMRAGAGVPTVLVATSVINLRYVLFSATLAPYVRRMPPRAQAFLAFSLTDETFAVNVTDLAEGRATAASMAGVGAISWAGWVLGTALGAGASSLIGDPSRFGVEFAMAAMFTALLVAQVKARADIIVGLIAGASALALATILPGKWFIVAAALVGATVGAILYRGPAESGTGGETPAGPDGADEAVAP
jgi:4-azaleucine resistance transporter AzlC